MPRSDSKGSVSEPYDPLASPTNSSSSQTSAGMSSLKKKHVCPTCERAFTTSGHLARHSRVHTGEKNHKCPFPGCETRCSRQDNLQQHYRIHLSPGSRRTSSRSSRSSRSGSSRRGANSGLAPASSSNTSFPPPNSPPALAGALSIPPPPLSPPPLEPAHPNGPQGRMVYGQHSPPPDSPPALAPATLPIQSQSQSQYISSRSANSSPDGMYSTPSFASSSGMGSMPSENGQPSQSPTIPAPGYSYRVGTSAYHEQVGGHGGEYSYIHPGPVSSSNAVSEYSDSASNSHSLPHINTLNYNSSLSRSGSPSVSATSPNSSAPVSAAASPLSSVSSRHSISHISHSQSYPSLQSQSSIQGIGHSPSPVSANHNSSHGQILPSVSSLSNVYPDSSVSANAEHLSHSPHYDAMVNPPSTSSSPHALQAGQTSNATYSPALSVQSNGSAGSMPQPLAQHASGQNILGPSLSRFESPPPVLAPLQGYVHSHHALPPPRMIEERYGHGDAHSHGSGSAPNAPQRSYSDRYDAAPHTSTHNDGYSRNGYGAARYSTDDAYLGHHAHGSAMSSNAYGNYGGGMGGVSLGHGAWKTESGLGRSMKGIGALVQ
ncbi:hypothetical protein D9758_015536 [Tetrapyrgos nigripes]|uniref:C2H2-type domain-containing protein n=1 Tax=Tetrapyrgos nigripes TaxID=182062 RepID=A0A8H5C319_9AGAR|nr:hypothetical protein D9758_015536 [Tetrapyrgos nigripes]